MYLSLIIEDEESLYSGVALAWLECKSGVKNKVENKASQIRPTL